MPIRNSRFVVGNKVNMWTLHKFSFGTHEIFAYCKWRSNAGRGAAWERGGTVGKVSFKLRKKNYILLSSFSPPKNPGKFLSCLLEGILKKRILSDIWMDVYFWVESEQNLSFICVSSLFFASTPGVLRWIPSFPFQSIHHRRCRWEKRKVESEMSYDRSRFSPGKFTTLSTLPIIELGRAMWSVRAEKLYAKIASTLNLFSSFTHQRHVYYIDFDIIAIILQTMMCFSSPTFAFFLLFHLCVSKQKYFLSKEQSEIDGALYAFSAKIFFNSIWAYLGSFV